MNKSEIEQLFVEKFSKFTKPQQVIINKLLSGHKLTAVNTHRMNNGEYKWIVPSSQYLEYAGHVHKAFRGVEHSIYKLTNVRVNLWSFYFV
jgi:hypothetical protein